MLSIKLRASGTRRSAQNAPSEHALVVLSCVVVRPCEELDSLPKSSCEGGISVWTQTLEQGIWEAVQTEQSENNKTTTCALLSVTHKTAG